MFKKLILSVVVFSTVALSQVDSTQIILDRYNKENEAVTGSITKQIVQKDLAIQNLLQANVQLSKENQALKMQLEACKKEEKKK